MDFAQENKAGSRTTAFILVVGIHILLIWAIVSGLAQKMVEKAVGPIETKVIEEVKPPPPPEDLPPPPPPDLKTPPPPFVPVPEIQIQTAAPPPPITTQSQAAPPPQEFRPAPPPAPVVAPPPPRPAGPVQAKVVCTKMPLPEISADFDSPGEFEATITLKGGRVSAITMKVIKGIPDRRAQRAIISSLDSAIRQYECGSYDGEVVQPFLVKPE
ncbi:MAG: ABC transporter substrate-binding protein [Burkholderiales bacterium]|uniref:ABC transporter substrate-binding protein n=1 Tax=Inhella sp. TaxID=1921806 RepID=UPI001AC0282F|nr:ABC transporter substrate-binding protein [Burkholderiales bacterium]